MNRAIGGWILCGVWIGCSPDLTRGDGSLTLSVVEIPPAVDRVRAVLEHDGWQYQTEVAAAGTSGQLQVESVPAGALTITAQAWSAGTLLRERTIATEIEAGRANAVLVSLREGAPAGEHRSEPIAIHWSLGPDDLREDKLEAKGTVPASSFATFFEAATNALGGAPTELVVASLTLQVASATGVSALNELWAGPAQVLLESETDEVRVAQGALPAALEGAVPVVTHDLIGLANALSAGEGELELEGRTPLSSGNTFSANVIARIVFLARR